LSAKKYLLDFSAFGDARPTCRLRLSDSRGVYKAMLYNGSTKVTDIANLNETFSPARGGVYNLILINLDGTWNSSHNGWGLAPSAVEVTIDCETQTTPCANGNYEITMPQTPSMESFSCRLSPDKQTAKLCITATNGVVTATGDTCYSNAQSASGFIDSQGNFSVDFRWGGYGSGLNLGTQTGEVAAGKFTGQFVQGTNNRCVMQGTASGEYRAWNTTKPSWCPSGFDIKQTYSSPGFSKDF
jgi:hypothetical protein